MSTELEMDFDVEEGATILSELLEFSSVTATEAADLLGHITERVMNFRSAPKRGPKREDPDETADVLLEMLNIVMLKLRGMALIVPPGPILKQCIPEVTQIEGYEELRDMCEKNAEAISALLFGLVELVFNPGYTGKSRIQALTSDNTLDEMDEICAMTQEIAQLIDALIDIWYENHADD